MYKIMIVDDEEPVLDSFAYMVENNSSKYRVCGKARSGFEAISLAHQETPDLVFMDIGMQGIDGLETIKELQRTYPDILFVLSTAYERFDLAQRAIPLGVIEYLVKPISKKRFLETLDKAEAQLDEKHRRTADHLADVKVSADSREWEEKNFLLTITWKGLRKKEWDRYRKLFAIDSDMAAVLLLKIRGIENEETSEQLYKEISSEISHKYKVLSTDYLGKLLVFFPGNINREKLNTYIDGILRRIVPPGYETAFGLGSFHSYETFYRSCGEALKLLPDMDEDLCGGIEEWESLLDLRRRIKGADSFEKAQTLMTDYSEKVFCTLPFLIAKSRMVMLFTLLLDDFHRSLGGNSASCIPFDPAREIMELAAKEDWDAWSCRALRNLIEADQNRREKELPAVLGRAMYYIQGNYDKPLQLSDAAAFCGVSPGYLSRLFTENLNKCFVDYLTTVRVKVAEEFLLENRLSIKEIAYAVGYPDPNYFSRIFRKLRGISPSTYLQERMEDEKV
ncbi:response regulator [Marispirochaeta sp.]|uniref:response regulator transcription factor n=1 Tax=Marispirochaeta sp. TaxID=2038653 RepID=UPI0029C777B2|nr:response regulator [Marispirochaeta sp.]